MIDSIATMQLFVRVVEAESFSQAAKQSGISKSAVSMQISRRVLSSHTPRRLHYEHEGKRYAIDTRGRITVNDEIARTALVCQRLGLGLMPAYEALEALKHGELVQLFEHYPIAASLIYAVYHDRRFVPQKVSVFIDYFRDYLGAQEWTKGIDRAWEG
jgi:DNA-binding transcriptional LysR family regulator